MPVQIFAICDCHLAISRGALEPSRLTTVIFIVHYSRKSCHRKGVVLFRVQQVRCLKSVWYTMIAHLGALNQAKNSTRLDRGQMNELKNSWMNQCQWIETCIEEILCRYLETQSAQLLSADSQCNHQTTLDSMTVSLLTLP